jgi:hypothetical protein
VATDPEVARALAEVHAELILIHPCRDGNGRVARLLPLLMGLKAGLPPEARRFQCATNALMLVGSAERLPLAKVARIPSTAEDDWADTRSPILRCAADFKWGLKKFSIGLGM